MTLDRDDLKIAKHWLSQPSRWSRQHEIEEFQSAFASWNGSEFAFAFSSAREALSASITAVGLRAGDEVIVPGYTCVVVANAFEFAGVNVTFCDIELETYGPDVTSVEQKLSSKTRAILLHHLYGLVARDYRAVLELAESRGLLVIEDCAQATGAVFQGVKVGNRGAIGIYSTEQSKVLNTVHGGLATTNDRKLARKLHSVWSDCPLPSARSVRNQLVTLQLNYYQAKHSARWIVGKLAGARWRRCRVVTTTDEEVLGHKPLEYGQRMSAPAAAVGINQLQKVDSYNAQRRKTAKHWERWRKAKQLPGPRVVNGSNPVFLRYPVLVEPEQKRDLRWCLRDARVRPGVWFVSQLHPSPRKVMGCPRAAEAVGRCINLPTLGLDANSSKPKSNGRAT
jgi:dTDP-4-amino-4,6-dideoxygalactose transaminase